MDDSLPQQDDQRRAIELAYRALTGRERTVFELRAFLERKRVGPAAIEAAVEELTRAGFLDDARYARQFAEDKRELERWGSGRIERDLARRGIAPDLVEAALAGQGRADELASAVVLLAERVSGPLDDDRARNKAWQLLVRRGYTPELAYEAVRAHGNASGDSSRSSRAA
jgi:regulatory protein